MLRVIIDRMGKQYDYVVIDNEAGMEHLSRRTTRDVDVLLLITDPTQRGLVTAQRMAEMVPELEIGVGHTYLVVNRLPGEMPTPLAEAIAETGLTLLGTIPNDPAATEFEFSGRPLIELPTETPVYRAIQQVAGRILETG
jgi:CO dehydrogenase maturation factor